MKFVFSLLLQCAIVLVVTGCATTFETAVTDSNAVTSIPVLRVQNLALTPQNGGSLVQQRDLQAGDILLSATNGITSASIRLLTLAPVSHASLYIGDGFVVEAVGEGVRKRLLGDIVGEEDVVVAFRHPGLQRAQQEKLRAFVLTKVGRPYNHFGIVLQAPFTIERRLCELPLLPGVLRNACLYGMAAVQLGSYDNDRFFCSQLVLESFRQAGLPLTDADPRWISPSDILHMREGDVPSIKANQSLVYIGHLKFSGSDLTRQVSSQ